MRPIKVTLFNGTGNGKVPFSKTMDNRFIFVTKQTDTLKEAMNFLSQNFSLSRYLDLKVPMNLIRNKEELTEFVPETLYNLTLDIDEINDINSFESVIEYFREKKYSVILCKSKSFDGKTNFNIKGIIRSDISSKAAIIKNSLKQMQTELGDCCKIDQTVANVQSLQAPTFNDFVVYYNEKGKILSESDTNTEEVKVVLEEAPSINYDNDIIDKSLEILWSLGFKIKTKGLNDNRSINFEHISERKSKGSYFWFASNPFIMHHPNKEKSVNIYDKIKDTPEGKKFLKDKTKTEQKNKLIKPINVFSYKDYIIVNERYLDFEKEDKKNIVNSFLSQDNSVLKIRSAMGSAKSAGIEYVISESHKRNKKIIIVSNRVSVAKDFADKYELMMYKDPRSSTHAGSIVVQYDSLHRFDISNYDVVIFDEFMSLILHHRAGLTDNANINAVKFKILMESKQVLIADAFLTGYENEFFKNRIIFSIINEYKDSIKLFEYKNKEFFVSSIIQKCKNIGEDEHISCSFTSLNVMRVVEHELKLNGIKVVSLSSETSEITRSIIYNRFKEETHNAFQVILFTPTLTVGVSNLNNVVAHFHYDSGMSTDVISSLQMIKRSRTTGEIHYYVAERQFYYDTSIESINLVAEKNINTFYNKKDKTLLIDVDYTNGKLILTPLAKYINQIEVFYNILSNNHANAFKLLLNYQFKSDPETIETEDTSFSLSTKVKEVKERIKVETIELLNQHSDISWSSIELEEIKRKTSEKTDEEKAKILLGSIQDRFSKEISKEELLKLALKEIEYNYKFISFIKNMSILINNSLDDYASYRLSKAISEDISSLQNKHHIDFLEYLLISKDINLKKAYSFNEVVKIDADLNKGKKFEKFLKKLGYRWGEAKIKIDEDVLNFVKYI